MTILFTGGGTMGPVTPLLAVARRMREMEKDVHLVWAGTKEGPEKSVVEREKIPFYDVPVAKVPRFISLRLGTFPIDYWKARRRAREILADVKPDLVVSAGAFSSVAIMHEAKKRGIPCATHQLDYKPGLANRIMARWCDSVTTTFEYKKAPFGRKSARVKTPCRFTGKIADRQNFLRDGFQKKALARFGLDPDKKTLFVFGGGTGALALNDVISELLDDLLREIQVIHVTGSGKGSPRKRKHYVTASFFDEKAMLDAYAASDLVISRAGLGTISELACLQKAAILVPIPHSHQEANAEAMPFPIIEQKGQFAKNLLDEIRGLIDNEKRKEKIGKEANHHLPTDDGTDLAKRWLELVKK